MTYTLSFLDADSNVTSVIAGLDTKAAAHTLACAMLESVYVDYTTPLPGHTAPAQSATDAHVWMDKFQGASRYRAFFDGDTFSEENALVECVDSPVAAPVFAFA